MTENQEFSTFEEFFPFYVGQHRKPATRWFHFAGTHLGASVFAWGTLRHRRGLMFSAPLLAYGAAWFSHFVIEKNRPATFGHPLWSLRGDFKMLTMMWQGQDDQLQEMADESQRITIAA